MGSRPTGLSREPQASSPALFARGAAEKKRNNQDARALNITANAWEVTKKIELRAFDAR